MKEMSHNRVDKQREAERPKESQGCPAWRRRERCFNEGEERKGKERKGRKERKREERQRGGKEKTV